MKEREIDVAIVGAGSAGLYALKQARRHTENLVIFDGGELGTTCARIGCMPSKMLIHSSDNLAGAREPDVSGDNIRPNSVEIMRTLRERRDRMAEDVIRNNQRHFDKWLIRDYAAFREPMVLEAEDTAYRCRAIVLATGTSPILPPGWKKVPGRIVTTDEFFELENLPEKILVVGAGVIGVEIGQALARMGKRVTIVEMTGSSAGISDPEVEQSFLTALRKSVDLRLRTKALLEGANEEAVRVILEGEDGKKAKDSFDLALVAAGRRPNFERLRLDLGGLARDRRGIPEFDPRTLRCREENVFLAGDCLGVRPFLHEAAVEGKLAGDNAGDPENLRTRPEMVPIAITFTRPIVCSVGTRFADLPAGAAIGSAGMPNGRGVTDRIEDGLIRVYGDQKNGRILGAEMAAPAGEHLAHLLAALIHSGMTAADALALPFYHPTYEESLEDALLDLRKQLQSEKVN